MTSTNEKSIETLEFEPLEIESHNDNERHVLLQSIEEVQDTPHSTYSPKFIVSILIFMVSVSIALAFVVEITKGTEVVKASLQVTFPVELLQNVYHKADFINKQLISPPYWEDANANAKTFRKGLPHMGPCYLPKTEQDWPSLVEQNKHIKSKKKIQYRDVFTNHPHGNTDNDLSGLCRPGFVIIGQGKCGTSSLYQYLVGHDRVLPAKDKQIHYFKYWTSRPMKWYLSNFPPAETFLSNGALMTGEASPGYLPYPNVAHILGAWMRSYAGNGIDQPVGSPKIITIMRNPLERSWSSYKYNYRDPLLANLRKRNSTRRAKRDGKIRHSDEWYQTHKIFSFEDLVRAELEQLKECLAPGGDGELGTRLAYNTKGWAAPEFERRKAKGLPGLIALDETCYGKRPSKTVPRRQWKDLIENQPNKEIDVPNLHLVQSLIGRSIYVLPLEWWYALYPKNDLFVVCTEDLRYRSNETVANVSEFLGLPSFDFTNVTSVGIYNSGAHTGYDTVTKWNNTVYVPDDIPISDELRKEYMEFVNPYNERLFQLTGKRCNWYEK